MERWKPLFFVGIFLFVGSVALSRFSSAQVRAVDAIGLFASGMGSSRRNGELLGLTEAEFDVFVTVDRNLSLQQDLQRFRLAVVVLIANSNRHSDPPTVASCASDSPEHVGTRRLIRVGA